MRRMSFRICIAIICLFSFSSLFAQMQVERLDRGTVAARKAQGNYVSWRLLAGEDYTTSFNLYRGALKLNSEPLTQVTSYYDSIAPAGSAYYVKAIVRGVEIDDKTSTVLANSSAGANAAYLSVAVTPPAGGITPPYTVTNNGTVENYPSGQSYSYKINDGSAGDLDGDGRYDLVIKWDPSNARDNAHGGITGNVYLEGLTLDGTRLWRIDLGPNIRAGAHYTQFLVYDFDGNGKAEIMVKTAPGTKDASGNFLSKGPAQSANHSMLYRNSWGYILSGPEYLTVFDGETGLELETADYWPLRGVVSKATWGDDYGNRVDRFNAAVAYVDGKRPSAIFQRGYYTRLTMAAWDWREGKLTRRWTFDSNNSGNGAYYGQGNHSIHVIDANGDGLHDLVTGSSVISGTGAGLNTSGVGHGDACHVTYMKKGDSRPMIFMPHENSPYGMSLRYAYSKDLLWRKNGTGDTGRGCAAELDPTKPGFHFWAAGMGLADLYGEIVGSAPSSCNFVIWWDGNLSRELMNSNSVTRWSIASNSGTNLFTGSGATSINGTKSTPVLQADILGDWREEVILARTDNKALLVYTTSMPTNHRLYTFMHDPVYRVAVSCQNSSYNQPPHPGFYVASDMDFPPSAPNVAPLAGLYRGNGNLVSHLMVNDLQNAQKWFISSDLQKSKSLYGDVTLLASAIPDILLGQEWIKTSTESKSWVKGDTLATFKVLSEAVVSIFHHDEVTVKPDWLRPYTPTGDKIIVSSPISPARSLSLYEKIFKAGELVALGPNSTDSNPDGQMYFVVVRKANGSSTEKLNTLELALVVYPQPASSWARVEYELEKKEPVQLGLYDLTGKLVMNIEQAIGNEGKNSVDFETSSLTPGIYLLRLESKQFTASQKIVIKR